MIEHHGGWTLIRLTGLSEGPALDALARCVEQLQELGERHLRFDLSHVELVDSAGLDLLDAASGQARAGGGRVEVTGASERVRTLFALVDMDRLLAVDDATPAEAWSASPRA